MRYIIAAAAFALVVGIALGFVVSRELDGSASAAPRAQAVEEQNLDGSGFIAVHEQGTANVAGTVDVGNLPAIQDVNVVSAPSQEPRLIELTFTTVPTSTSISRSNLVDISDCGLISVFVLGSSGLNDTTLGSPDGTQLIPVRLTGDRLGVSAPIRGASLLNVPMNLPFILITAGGSSSQQGEASTGWIYCAP